MSIEIKTGYGDPFSFDNTDDALDFIKSVVRANKGKIEIQWGPRAVLVPPAPLTPYTDPTELALRETAL
jgi:hypothetical protein